MTAPAAAAGAVVRAPFTGRARREWYAVGVFYVAGIVNLSYPFWWLSFRNHSPGVRLNPVPVVTPFNWSGVGGHFQVTTFSGTFAAFGAGAVMLLAAPWVTRGVAAADRWLIRGLLGPGRLTQRVHDLEQTRALAVEDAAARLRRLERDLHDGAQIRLATLAMNLGMARKKLGDQGAVPDVAAARELVGAARRCAKDALVELRELARGIHPPVLDNGLADALASLAATSAIPAELVVSVPVRPTPAIETIAYFCAAELLANAAKHSQANTIKILMTERAGFLALRVTDDGTALDREVVSQLLAASRHAGDLDPLTPRERDVLALMAEGRSNAGVAAALVLTLGTVEKHVASIFGKLGLPASETDNRRVLAVLRYLGS